MALQNTKSAFGDFLEDSDKKGDDAKDEMSFAEYLELCRVDKTAYATPAQRLLAAIGEPEIIDTAKDPKLSRIFQNKSIARYSAFADFYGAEELISKIVDHVRNAAQGLEESKQVLYILGPVGGGKSSVAERIKQLMEDQPFYAVKGSPIHENPLGLLDQRRHGAKLQALYGIEPRYLKPIMSPWAAKRIEEHGSLEEALNNIRIVKVQPSITRQIGISKTEPGDENNQDISALTGKVDLRKLEEFAQNDPDSYSYSGGLCRGNRGIMEFVEMFKAPIKVLNPMLEATQSGSFKGTEDIGVIPFEGIILAHSNESEWEKFRNNKQNEAFLDRINIVRAPYTLRVSEEVKIYKKNIAESNLAKAPCAPGTLEMLARWSVLTRLKDHENSNIYSKMKVYDGENLKDVDPRAKSIQEYKDKAGLTEGMTGMSTRFAFKTLSQTFNFKAAEGGEIAANPVHLMYVLENRIKNEQLPEDTTKKYLGYINDNLRPEYKKFIAKEVQEAYHESSGEYGQNLFDRYITYADFWLQDQDYRDPDTGQMLNRATLNTELEKLEKPAGISNPKDFRNEVVNFVMRAQLKNGGKNPSWTSYEKLKNVIEKRVFSSMEEVLPLLASGGKGGKDNQKKYDDYVDRMQARGYTQQQIPLVTDYYVKSMNP